MCNFVKSSEMEMEENLKINSTQNPRIKRLVELQQKSSVRRESGLAVVEGRRELGHCIDAGFQIKEIYFCRQFCNDIDLGQLSLSGSQMIEVSRQVYERIAYRGSTEGIIAIVRPRMLTLADLHLSENPLIAVLESVEKPGNVGAVLRSAEAAGTDAVILCDSKTDLYNPNLIRSSIGSVFRIPVVECSSEECILFLKSHGIRILTAQLQDSELYYHTDMRHATVIVMGTEDTGLTDAWRHAADAHIRIPMNGAMDSLNVSVSAAILLYEAVRQRNE